MSHSLVIAVTGMSAGSNPAPGVAVIRSLRAASWSEELRAVGLSYDPLDTGNYLNGIADSVYLMPFPSQGSKMMFASIQAIHKKWPVDVLLPTLDAELPVLLKLAPRLRMLGIHTFLPRPAELELRSKAKLGELQTKLGISVPRSVTLYDPRQIATLGRQIGYPAVIKGQYYEAYVAGSPAEAESFFARLRERWGLPVIAQEHIAGQEYDVAALGDGEGSMVGSVAMRKMQLNDKNKAWGGVTVDHPGLYEFVKEAVAKLRWRGPCELEVMHSARDQRFYLIEINPRFPAWIYLSVGAERNLPAATVRLALGEEVEVMEPAAAGAFFLRHCHDEIHQIKDYEMLMTQGELNRGVS
jgi:carbamoyl-phosphate synthase large subunit